MPHLPNHHHYGGDPINDHDDHRRDLYNAARDLYYHDRDYTINHVRAVHRAAAAILNDDIDPGYSADLGPLNLFGAPIDPAAVRVNIDGTTYRLTPATGDTLTDDRD